MTNGQSRSNRRQMRKWLGWGAAGILLALLITVGAGAIYLALTGAEPMPEALAALESDESVRVSEEPWLIFEPTGTTPDAGFIFYPGGGVDARAYAPPARALAEAGTLVVIPPMPLDLAVLAPNRAAQVMAAFPAVEQWSIGGHSLGGAMAASYAHRHPDEIHSLILWAAYPPNGSPLAEEDLAVASIYASNDGLATVDDIDASRPLLPPDTAFVLIEGGNHAQFGWYGEQEGDGPAEISREEQQRQAVAATLETLGR